ncbi:MAG: aminoacyl-tRNA hydrolase [Erysipelotrichaceae bacterium]|nr:aminoacyl-tRNA hydrolase [Erysipelotrichaceae bacterium]
MKLIIGLGNPEAKYDGTRHNTGFMVMDRIAKQCQVNIDQKKFKALVSLTNIRGEKVLLMKPLTYMNLSGEAIQMAMHFYQIDPSDICVIYDDMDLPCGQLRLREKGSAGGHNGMKSIISHIGTDVFPRIRVGIDHSPYDTIDYVLGRFSSEQMKLMESSLDRAADAALAFVTRKFQDVMNIYNRKSL